jgi:RNA polymerase sigma-70 factor, ECF subfamily
VQSFTGFGRYTRTLEFFLSEVARRGLFPYSGMRVESSARLGGGQLSLESLSPLEQLIRDCAESNDSGAWDEFVSRSHRPISLSVLRTARLWVVAPQSLIEDLVQETYLKLCANRCRSLLEFAQQHPEAIMGYVKTVAVNLTHDYFKSRYSQKRGSGKTGQPVEQMESSVAAANEMGPDAIERGVLLRQVKECLESCSEGPDQERDRTIFWFYYRQGVTAKDIAALPGIGLSPKGVESLIFRLTRLVRERLVNTSPQTDPRESEGEKGLFSAESY